MKNIKTEIKWAFIFIVMMLLWMLMEKITGLHDRHIDRHAILSNLVAIPAIAIYVFALLDKRKKDYQGYMTYKQGFISGMIITVIITLFTPLVQYITSTFISPQYFPNVINYSVEKGIMAREEAEKYFNLKNYILQGTIGSFIMGLITAAIVALFTRKAPKVHHPDV